METKHVTGRNAGKLMLYASRTCPWCMKTKTLLNEMGVEYQYIDIDGLQGSEMEEVVSELDKWNRQRTLPTLVINDSKVIIGFRESEIRKTLQGTAV